MPAQALSEFDRASVRLRSLGLTLRSLPGEYRVNFRNGADDTARSAADLDEAIAIGEAMAEIAGLCPHTCPARRHPSSSAKRYRRRFIRRHNKWFRQRCVRGKRRA